MVTTVVPYSEKALSQSPPKMPLHSSVSCNTSLDSRSGMNMTFLDMSALICVDQCTANSLCRTFLPLDSEPEPWF